MYDPPWDWARGGARAPGWGVRSVKFSPPGVGREVMTFTEVCQVYAQRGTHGSINCDVVYSIAHVVIARRGRANIRNGRDRPGAQLRITNHVSPTVCGPPTVNVTRPTIINNTLVIIIGPSRAPAHSALQRCAGGHLPDTFI